MISVLHLLGANADFQTRRTHQSLQQHLQAHNSIATRSLGRGGDYPNLASAVRHLRKSPAHVVHAWGLNALTAAALAGSRKILFSPETFAGPKTIRWVRA